MKRAIITFLTFACFTLHAGNKNLLLDQNSQPVNPPSAELFAAWRTNSALSNLLYNFFLTQGGSVTAASATNIAAYQAFLATNGFVSGLTAVGATNAAKTVVSWSNSLYDVAGSATTVSNAMAAQLLTTSNALQAEVSGAASSFPPLSNTAYVSALGNDATAIRGRLDKPALTLSNALALAHLYDTVAVMNGLYFCSNWMSLRTNLTLAGESPEYTTLVSASAGEGGIYVTNDALVENLSVISTNTQPPVWIVGGTNVTCRNVHTVGDWDGFISMGTYGNILIDNCISDSSYDCMQFQNSGTHTIKNSVFRSLYSAAFPHPVRALVVGLAGTPTVYVDNCYLSAENGQAGAYAVYVQAGNVFLNNCTLSESHSAATGAKLLVAGGTVTISGCNIGPDDIIQTGGTIIFTPGTYNGGFTGNGAGLTNLAGASVTGQMTNNTTGTASGLAAGTYNYGSGGTVMNAHNASGSYSPANALVDGTIFPPGTVTTGVCEVVTGAFYAIGNTGSRWGTMNGGGLTNLQATALTGTVPPANLPGVAIGTNATTFTAGIAVSNSVTASLTVTTTNTISATSTTNRTSYNGPRQCEQLVTKDAGNGSMQTVLSLGPAAGGAGVLLINNFFGNADLMVARPDNQFYAYFQQASPCLSVLSLGIGGTIYSTRNVLLTAATLGNLTIATNAAAMGSIIATNGVLNYGTGWLGTTNANAPGNTSTIVAWVNYTNAAGNLFKMPLYQ